MRRVSLLSQYNRKPHMNPFPTLILLVALPLAIFWLYELFTLMQMPDDAFPGRNDKPIWAVILLVLPVAGAVLFMIWKLSAHAQRDVDAVAGELSELIQRSSAGDDSS